MARLWQAWGVQPHCLMGHSLGELVAAQLAGILSLEDAAKLVCERARLVSELGARDGGMVSLQASAADVEQILAELDLGLEVSAVNSQTQVVVTGGLSELRILEEHLAARGLRTKALRVSHAFHSKAMDAVLEPLREVCRQLQHHPSSTPFISCHTGAPLKMMEQSYWLTQLRDPVRFSDAVESAQKAGTTLFLECGPAASLSSLVSGVPSQRKDRDELWSLMAALGALACQGVELDWEAIFGELDPRPAGLPTYPFQRQRYWVEATPPGSTALDTDFLETLLELPPHLTGEVEGLLPYLQNWSLNRQIKDWGYGQHWCPSKGSLSSQRMKTCWLVADYDSGGGWAGALQRKMEELDVSVRRYSFKGALGRLESGDCPQELALVFLASPSDQLGGRPWMTVAKQGLRLAQLSCGSHSFQGRVWFLTPHAIAAREGESPSCPELMTLWGVGRALSLEKPRSFAGLVDLPEQVEAIDQLAALLLQAEPIGDEFALRDSLLERRLKRAWDARSPALSWQPKGTVLVTGGTGFLGTLLCHWLVERGVQQLVLTTRREQCDKTRGLSGTLQEKGCQVEIVTCDLRRSARVNALVEKLGAQLKHIFHLGGEVSTEPLEDLTEETFGKVMEAKAKGAWTLHNALVSHQIEVDSFVMYGSIAGFWGAGLQAAYAAANAALTGLAYYRRARGLAAGVVHWGSWEPGGINTEEASTYLERRGILSIPGELGLRALDRFLLSDDVEIAVANLQWEPFAKSLTSGRARPFLQDFYGPEKPAAPQRDERLRRELTGLSQEERLRRLEGLIRRELSQLLELPLDSIPDQSPIQELGLDSLMAVELETRLANSTGCKLGKGLIYDYPDIGSLAKFLASQLGLGEVPNWTEREVREKLSKVSVEALRASGLLEAVMAQPNQLGEVQDSSSDIREVDREGLLELMEGLLGERGS